MAEHGFTAIFCNIKDFPPSEWSVVRKNASAAKVVCGPWSRMCSGDAGSQYDRAFLDRLVACADEWRAPFIVNGESEVDGRNEVVEEIVKVCGARDWAFSTLPTPFWDNDWTLLADIPVLPQCFGQSYADAYEVRRQWQARGVRCVVATFGTYSGWTPELYPLDAPYGLYTADDCGNNYAPWGLTGSCQPCAGAPAPQPPPTNGGTVPDNSIPPISPGEIIGSEHGITAFVDWLQGQSGMPVRNANYNPKKPGTWPWPERLERTLKILAADHDAANPPR